METENQNIKIVFLALVHVIITALWFSAVDHITEFVPALDERPKHYYLIHGVTLTPIITAIIGGGYVFKHRKKLSKKDVVKIWFEVLPWMCALSVIFLVWATFDPVYG